MPVLLVVLVVLPVGTVVAIDAVESLALVADEGRVLESPVTLLRVAEDPLPDAERDVESLDWPEVSVLREAVG